VKEFLAILIKHQSVTNGQTDRSAATVLHRFSCGCRTKMETTFYLWFVI